MALIGKCSFILLLIGTNDCFLLSVHIKNGKNVYDKDVTKSLLFSQNDSSIPNENTFWLKTNNGHSIYFYCKEPFRYLYKLLGPINLELLD